VDDAIEMGESMNLLGSESPRSDLDFLEDRERVSLSVGTCAHDSSPANAGRFSWIAS
jgi:hypothetical protein